VLRFDPFAMLPFCGYNMGDYFATGSRSAPRRRRRQAAEDLLRQLVPQGRRRPFLWPGYGENSRVLKWVFERLDGTADAVETAIGYLPTLGDGILVVTDRRLLGQMNGESPLSDRIDDGGDGHLYFSMGYEDVDSISISQETTKVGALEERRVNVQGLEILGALGVEVFATMTLSRDDVTTSTLRSGRPFFDQVVHAAATYRMDLDPTLADRYQLKRVLDGEYEMEDDELVAALIVDRV
jgi:hypothetical protein